MPFLALGLRTGVKYICIRSEFSPERSNMIKLYGELAEHPIWVAVQYSEVSGNIAFKLLITPQERDFFIFSLVYDYGFQLLSRNLVRRLGSNTLNILLD